MQKHRTMDYQLTTRNRLHCRFADSCSCSVGYCEHRCLLGEVVNEMVRKMEQIAAFVKTIKEDVDDVDYEWLHLYDICVIRIVYHRRKYSYSISRETLRKEDFITIGTHIVGTLNEQLRKEAEGIE